MVVVVVVVDWLVLIEIRSCCKVAIVVVNVDTLVLIELL